MKKVNTLAITALAMMVSVSVWANANGHENDQTDTPMMNEGESNTMMNSHKTIGTKDRKNEHHKTHRMDPHMMHMMDHYQMGQRQHQNISGMGGEHSDTMNPQMMQMRQQHMETMEQRLANIEALLEKLVELQ